MGCVSSRSFLCRIFGGLLDAKTFYLQKITNKIHDIVSFRNNMAISAHGTLCLLRQQGVLASDLSLLRSRLHRRSGVAAGVGGGRRVSSVFPQEPPSGTLPSCVWFFALPVWQLVCKQYMAVLHRVAKPYINGVARVPRGPAPLRCILVSCVTQMCLFLSLFDHSYGEAVLADVLYPCLRPPCLSFWKD